MLLRNSFSNTKRFFRKTLQSFKSFFSVGCDHYQRIPKTSPYNPNSYSLGAIDMNIQASYKDLDKFYTDFSYQWESADEEKDKKRSNKKNIESSPIKQEKEVHDGSFVKFTKTSPLKNNNNQRRENQQYLTPKSVLERTRQEDSESYSTSMREERSCLLADKLRELEMMDMSNVDHVLDIEEVLYYYSRLTCPAYLDIVDKFFMDMYAEFFGSSANPSAIISSRKQMLRSERS